MTSTEPTPGRCNATTRNDEYCENYPVDGADRCRMHGGTADNRGERNGNYKHGAFAAHFRDHLTDAEQEALGDVVEQLESHDTAERIVRELVAEAIMKYKRSGDVRFLSEVRQLMATFNLADATDHVDMDARTTEVSYTVVRDADDDALPADDTGSVDYETLGFTQAPGGEVDVEVVDEVSESDE